MNIILQYLNANHTYVHELVFFYTIRNRVGFPVLGPRIAVGAFGPSLFTMDFAADHTT
jgi:hypothetical protein